MGLGGRLHRGTARQIPAQAARLGQRAVGHHGHALLLHPGQQIKLHTPAAQMIQHLIGGAPAAAGHFHQLVHVQRVKVGNAPGPDASLRLQLLHALHRLGQGHRAPPVQQVQVQIIGAQPPQRVFAAQKNAAPVRVKGVHLGDQIQRGPVHAPDGAADQMLRCALAVHFGGVDQVHACLHARLQRLALPGGGGGIFAQIPGSLADAAHRPAVFRNEFHACCPFMH